MSLLELCLFKYILSCINQTPTTCHILSSLPLLGLHVGSNKELTKEEEKSQNVNKVSSSDPEAMSTTFAVSQEVNSLGHHRNELKQLHHGQ